MSSNDPCVLPNAAEVAAKVMDGEAILINLSNGMYYSMDGAGGFLWQLVEAQAPISAMVDALCTHYAVDREQADADVRSLVAALVQAGLVSTSDWPAGGVAATIPAPPVTRLPYRAPSLNAYHDMAELLALDPPHPSLTDTLSKTGAGE